MEYQVHPIPPVYDEQSEILILGSFPSVASRDGMFFYHHPQNRFWKVLSGVLEEPFPQTIAEKTSLLLRRHIALWDVIASCEITGSSDSSVRNVVPNDLSVLLHTAPIRKIFCNGSLAHRMYEKHTLAEVGIPACKLPSTSPANASWSLERLDEAWRVILP